MQLTIGDFQVIENRGKSTRKRGRVSTPSRYLLRGTRYILRGAPSTDPTTVFIMMNFVLNHSNIVQTSQTEELKSSISAVFNRWHAHP